MLIVRPLHLCLIRASRGHRCVQALSVVPKEGWAQILAFGGFIELVLNKKTSEPGHRSRKVSQQAVSRDCELASCRPAS